ncbi:MAG TPA: hypothetical protein VI138_06320 [Candidatus Dormibacteraeota bacterium]
MSRDSRRPARWATRALPTLLAGGVLLAGCVGPASGAKSALRNWLTDVHAHSVAYAYTLLSQNAERRTDYDAFFNGVNASTAKFRVRSVRVISSDDVEVAIEVSDKGAPPRTVHLQMVEEGNAGDWLVGAPFSTQGAAAIKDFK